MNFYFDAVKVLDRLDAKKGSIKSVIATLPEKDRKRSAALVIETLKYKDVLTDIIHTSGMLKQERQKITSLNLALVLVHDLLLSRGIQAGDGPIKQSVLRHKTRLNAELQKMKIKRGVKDVVELAQTSDSRSAQIPRYVRINTHVWTSEEAAEHFTQKGFIETEDPMESSKAFHRDEHIPDLFAFHPSNHFHDDLILSSGKIILQDKASCFPAVVLSPPTTSEAHVIDATAAPGNKTTHLSALMKNRGKLFAFERDKKRYATLRSMISKAHCKNVEAINADFLAIDPSDQTYDCVTHILLDPSCSGSGIVNRLDYLLDTENEDENSETERLAKLASFQLDMIQHAMKFQSVQRIVYSTCSVHSTENEEVVCRALTSSEAMTKRFTLASREEALPTWPRRGQSEHMGDGDASSLIRCEPGIDKTNGFFVSCFVKQSATHECASKKRAGNRDEDHDHERGRPPPSKRRKKKTK